MALLRRNIGCIDHDMMWQRCELMLADNCLGGSRPAVLGQTGMFMPTSMLKSLVDMSAAGYSSTSRLLFLDLGHSTSVRRSWSARERRRGLKQRTRRINDGYRGFVLEVALQTWKWGVGAISWTQRKIMILRELFATAIKFNVSWAKARIKTDKREFLNGFLRDIGGLSKCGFGARMRRKGRPVAASVRDAHGQLLIGRRQQDEAWMEFFGAMEGGRVLLTTEFLQARAREQPDAALTELDLDVGICPKLWELEAAYLTVPTGKAAGLDALPPEAFKYAAASMAELYYPLILKCMTKVVQPLQWTGGILFEAFKNSGLQTAMESYRSLYVASIPGKLFHRVMRQKFAGQANHQLYGLHCGAREGCSVTTPSLALRVMTRWARDRKLSTATIFLDTKTAYYAVARELATGPIHEDAYTEALFRKFGLDDADLVDLMELVQQGVTFREAGASQHLLEMIKSIYRNGWFVTRFTGGNSICVTTKGSRPGSCWADLVFTYIYARVLAKVRKLPECEGFGIIVKWSGTKELWTPQRDRHSSKLCLDTTWADDTAAMTVGRTPKDVVLKARGMSTALLDACRQHGLQPNFKKGKTMIVFAFRGRGAKGVAGEEFAGNKTVFRVPSKDGGGYEIYVSAGYIHLGTYLDKNGHMECEARRRRGIAASSFEHSRKVLFQNKHIGIDTRLMLFSGIVGASLFNLELWTPRLKGWSVLRKGYMKLQRRLLVHTLPDERPFKLAEAEVTFLSKQADLQIFARRKRIGFLVGMATYGSEEIWALAQWAEQVRDDLVWLQLWSDCEWPKADCASRPAWWHLLKERGDWVKLQTKKAQRRCLEQCWKQAALKLFLHDAATALRGSSWKTHEVFPDTTFWCMQCKQRFINKAGLSVHFFKKHGRKAGYRQYVHGTTCRACGTDFHAEKRLAMHLRASLRCRGVLAAMGLRNEEWDYGLSRSKRLTADEMILCPPEKKAEPGTVQPLARTEWEEFPLLRDVRSQLLDWLIEYEGGDCVEVREGLLRIISSFPLHAFEARLIFTGLAEDIRHVVEVEKLNVWQEAGPLSVLAVAEDLAQTFRLDWFAEGESCVIRSNPDEVSDALLTEVFWSGLHGAVDQSNNCPDEKGELLSGLGPRFLQLKDPLSMTKSCVGLCPRSVSVQQTQLMDVQVTGLGLAQKAEIFTVAEWQEGTDYLLTRLDLSVPLNIARHSDVCKGLLRLLTQLVQGNSIALSACTEFWDSLWSLPFRALFQSRPLHV